jgi:hypothetical protein
MVFQPNPRPEMKSTSQDAPAIPASICALARHLAKERGSQGL